MDENNIVPDESQPQSRDGLGNKVVSTVYKVEGWKFRINAIISFIVAAIIMFMAFIFSFIFHTFIIFGIALLPAILLILGAWYEWKRGRVLTTEGKFSLPWKMK
jgi:lipopolysaccharide export LptBFGC system permease protein LptF